MDLLTALGITFGIALLVFGFLSIGADKDWDARRDLPDAPAPKKKANHE